MSVAPQDVARPHHRQADDSIGPGRVAEDVALWSLLALPDLRLADVQVQDVALGVVPGAILEAWIGRSVVRVGNRRQDVPQVRLDLG